MSKFISIKYQTISVTCLKLKSQYYPLNQSADK